MVKDESGLGIYAANLSADGRWLVFQYFVGHWAIFVQDLESGTRQQISVAGNGTAAKFDSFSPVISADGRWVAFSSQASNLVSNDTNEVEDVFVHDRQSGLTKLVSQSDSGSLGNQASELPIISADGQWIAFSSKASNLVANDTHNSDVFVCPLIITATLSATATVSTSTLLMQPSTLTTTTIGVTINDLAISPNGEMLAVAINDGTSIYSLPDFKHIRFWSGNYWVNGVAWSPDNERIASANYKGSVPMWDVGTGGRASLLGVMIKEDNKIAWQPKLVWSSNGEYIASNSVDENVYLWKVISGTAEIVLNVDGVAGVSGLAWSPNHRQMAISDANAVRIWEISLGQSRVILSTRGKYQLNDIAWSKDGQHVAFGGAALSDGRGLVHIWNELKGNELLEGYASPVTSVAWSPDGRLVSGAADGLRIWNITTGESQRFDNITEVTSVDWSADGHYLAAGTTEGLIYLWHMGE